MICLKCQGNSEQSSKCVLNALDIIKEHFFTMQSLCIENVNSIIHLKQRNEKLHSAVDLLKDQLKQRSKSSPKRRKCSPQKSPQQLKNLSRRQSTDNNNSPRVPESQDSLNMNIALQSDNDDETITETEPPISPYKPWNVRRKLNIRNCENVQPNSKITTDTKSSALAKISLDKFPMSKTKMSLTLRNNSPRLKQARQKIDVSKCDKDVIESSPNLYTCLQEAKKSRSLLQTSDNKSVLESIADNATSTRISNNQPIFDIDDDESIFALCPDPSVFKPPSTVSLPTLSGSSDTSVMLLTPATQDIVFIDDSIADTNDLNTMDFMEEVMKENDEASLTKLQEFEAKLIEEQKMAAVKQKPNKIVVEAPLIIKPEPLTEAASQFGNESTKLPEDFDMDENEQEEEDEEDIFPCPIVVKKEPEIKEDSHSTDCNQCEKYIKFMGANLSDEMIQNYLRNCKHIDERELANKTPDGFWNPHMH